MVLKGSRTRGCMFGSALGDALGKILRLSHFEQKGYYQDKYIYDILLNSQSELKISNETQMALFTAEGLLRSRTRDHVNGISHTPSVVYGAYLRWLFAQGHGKLDFLNEVYDGYLINLPEIYARENPGLTSISALKSGLKGEVFYPINDSKDSDGVSRIYPIGLFCSEEEAFKIGCECCAITHGHPTAYLTAGTFAYLISSIVSGMDIKESLNLALLRLKAEEGHVECSDKLRLTLDLFEMNLPAEECLHQLGSGWLGHESFAMGLYCALHFDRNAEYVERSFLDSLIMAVKYSDNPECVGTITGSIIGTLGGEECLYESLKNKIECGSLIGDISQDLSSVYIDLGDFNEKYPGH